MRPRQALVLGGRVAEGGVLRLDSRNLLDSALKHWDGLRVVVRIEQEKETRRQRANRFYWGVVLKHMASESGHSADDLHELMKLRHNSKTVEIVDPKTGEAREVRIPLSTAKLSIEEFGIYLERAIVDAAEWLGVVIPEPRRDEEWRTQEHVKVLA